MQISELIDSNGRWWGWFADPQKNSVNVRLFWFLNAPPPREVNLKRLQACRDVEARIAYQPWPDPASDPILYLRRQNCSKIICAAKIAPDVAKFTGLARNLGFAQARGQSCDLVIVFKTGRDELNWNTNEETFLQRCSWTESFWLRNTLCIWRSAWRICNSLMVAAYLPCHRVPTNQQGIQCHRVHQPTGYPLTSQPLHFELRLHHTMRWPWIFS